VAVERIDHRDLARIGQLGRAAVELLSLLILVGAAAQSPIWKVLSFAARAKLPQKRLLARQIANRLNRCILPLELDTLAAKKQGVVKGNKRAGTGSPRPADAFPKSQIL
jgi:hypothetical protein